jgi:hypothetical protein
MKLGGKLGAKYTCGSGGSWCVVYIFSSHWEKIPLLFTTIGIMIGLFHCTTTTCCERCLWSCVRCFLFDLVSYYLDRFVKIWSVCHQILESRTFMRKEQFLQMF